MGSKQQEEKKDDYPVGNVSVKYRDATGALQEYALNSATQHLKEFYKGELGHFKDVAEAIKNDFDGEHGGTWHCIVGRDFGSFVTHESDSILYFFLGAVGFMVWKHG